MKDLTVLPRVTVDGQPLVGQLALLLRYLVFNRHRWVSRDELIEALWPYSLPQRPDASLSNLLWKLNARLDGLLDGKGGPEVRLALPVDVWVDAQAAMDEARRARAAAERQDWESVREAADAVLGLVSPQQPSRAGDSLWLQEEQHRFENLRAEALEYIARAALETGGEARLAEGEQAARDLVKYDELRETSSRLLMQLCAERGNDSAGRTEYQRLWRQLRDAGREPASETVKLYRRVFEEDNLEPPRIGRRTMPGRDMRRHDHELTKDSERSVAKGQTCVTLGDSRTAPRAPQPVHHSDRQTPSRL